MTSDRRRLLVGFMQWFGTGLGLVSAYMLTLDSFAEWDWFTVSKGAIGHIGAGIGALAVFFKPKAVSNADNGFGWEPLPPPGHAVIFPPGYEYSPKQTQNSKALDLPLLRKELRNDEGVVHEIYLDSLGNKTAGIGRLITPDMPEYDLSVGTPIDTVTVEQWFAEDIGTAVSDAHMVVKDFDSQPKRVKHALVNLAFNLGRERLQGFKKTLAHIDAREYQAASIELLNSRYADQVKNRAKRVSSWIASGESLNRQPDIDLT